ncbi:MAG: nitrilase-related carbon-nitrogen hydrolase [Synechococcaceae cyanobacterium]|nr:nitrilase-related carbon-nitrogen hydrolase [Synechococcaceae cyanobacterium]
MSPLRRPVIGVMGAGEGASAGDQRLAEELGAAIARRGWVLLSGGRPSGVMAAACQGAMAIDGHLVVGVLPDDGAGSLRHQATAAVDLALFTGLGQARNVVNVLSSDVVVVCGSGGPGTLSEAAHALKAGRPLVLLATPDPWPQLLVSLGVPLRICGSVAEAIAVIEALLAPRSLGARPAALAAGLEQRLPVALVQLSADDDAAANRRRAEAWLERALQVEPGGPRPRLLMLPEIWNAPYDAARFAAYAEPIPDLPPAAAPDPLATALPGPDLTAGPSPSLAMVARLARRHGVSVIAGSIPERGADGRLYNTATVIDPEGRLRAKHRKLHLFDVDVPGGIRFRESDSLSGGSHPGALRGEGDPLATGLAQPPHLGLLICYDIRFPELALLLQQRHGCTLLACPAAFNTTTGPRHWHLLMRARAVDTQCCLLACSSARPLAADRYPSYGHSLVVDPWGTVIAEAGITEQVLHADLDLAAVQQARQAIPTAVQRRADVYRLGPA